MPAYYSLPLVYSKISYGFMQILLAVFFFYFVKLVCCHTDKNNISSDYNISILAWMHALQLLYKSSTLVLPGIYLPIPHQKVLFASSKRVFRFFRTFLIASAQSASGSTMHWTLVVLPLELLPSLNCELRGLADLLTKFPRLLSDRPQFLKTSEQDPLKKQLRRKC